MCFIYKLRYFDVNGLDLIPAGGITFGENFIEAMAQLNKAYDIAEIVDLHVLDEACSKVCELPNETIDILNARGSIFDVV